MKLEAKKLNRMEGTKDFTDTLTSMGVDVTVNKNPTNEELDRIKKLIDKNESIKKDVQSYLKGDVDLEYLNEKGIKISQPIKQIYGRNRRR
tara:strand:+ start:7923 stop:8195 length:273 start_codon:yes stop_codon:yes gene_type:complete